MKAAASLPFLADVLAVRAAAGPIPDKTPQGWCTWLETEVDALTRQSDPQVVRLRLVAVAALLTAWSEQIDRDAAGSGS